MCQGFLVLRFWYARDVVGQLPWPTMCRDLRHFYKNTWFTWCFALVIDLFMLKLLLGFSGCTFRSILWILSPIGFSPELRVVNPSGLATLDSTQSSQPPNQNVGSLEFLWWLMQLMCRVRHEEIATVLSGFTWQGIVLLCWKNQTCAIIQAVILVPQNTSG